MDDNNNEQLDQMEADRQNKLAEKSGMETLKRHAKKDKRKQMIKAIIKMIVAQVKAIMLPTIITTIIVSIIVSVFISIFGGDITRPNIFSGKKTEEVRVISLREYLQQFSHAGEAPQSDDGRFYKMYSDAPTSGWPTIGNSDLQWKSHQAKFACQGKVLKTTGENTESDVQAYVNSLLTRGADQKYSQAEIDSMGIYIEKSLVDSVGQTVAETYYQAVVTYTEGLNLSEQQLYALTAIQYNFEHLPTRNGYTFKSVYEEATGLYAINSWEHMMYIWDHWWAYIGGNKSGHIPSRDAAFETYVKGVYDFTYSEAGEVFGRTCYLFYTQEQLDALAEKLDEGESVPDKPLKRTEANQQETFTYKQLSSGVFDGETVTAAGYTFPHYLQKDFNRAYGSSTIKAAGCGPTSMAMILAGLCRDSSITPITFVDNMYEYYKDWRKFYLPGAGSYWGPLCNTEFLQKYYNCKSTAVNSMQGVIDAVSAGKCVVGAEKGHILAIIPLPDEYKSGGYAFFVLDSARGHSGAFKSKEDFINTTTATMLVPHYIIEPMN